MLKLTYFPDTDTLYINFSEGMGAGAQEVYENVIFDFNAQNKITGICIDHASELLNLKDIEHALIINQPEQEQKTA